MFVTQLDKPYGCCDKSNISLTEYLISSYYEDAEICMNNILTKAYGYELFGKDSELLFNKYNNFHYLLILMLYIFFERVNELKLLEKGIISEVTTTAEWEEMYDFECYRKTFSCDGCNVMPLFTVFGLNWIDNAEDGIGYMYIQPGSSPKNRVS